MAELKESSGVICDRNDCIYHKAEHMRALLKAEDEGRLIILPCKLYETVYTIPTKFVNGKRVNADTIMESAFYYTHYDFYDRRLSDNVFLTRAEAEAALEKASE